MDKAWIRNLRACSPRVHCITNYVTAGDVANAVLAVGGSPIMAQGENEVEDVTCICQSLVLNMGTLEKWTVKSMILAGQRAGELGHPIILDPVGITASAFRRRAVLEVLEGTKPSVIRGNEAEIMALNQALSGLEPGNTCGVDSVLRQADNRRRAAVCRLAVQTEAVVVMTGEEDLISDGFRLYAVRNGCPAMGRITGSGCMLDGVLGAFCGSVSDAGGLRSAKASQDNVLQSRPCSRFIEAVSAAVAAHGLCGEMAWAKTVSAQGGTGSFRMYFIDYLSVLDDEMLERGKRIEVS